MDNLLLESQIIFLFKKKAESNVSKSYILMTISRKLYLIF